MWIRHPETGVIVLVFNEAHITRLLGEGGQEVSDPRATPHLEEVPEVEQEQDTPTVQHENPRTVPATHKKPPVRKAVVRKR